MPVAKAGRQSTVAAPVFWPVFDYLRARGWAAERVFSGAGYSEAALRAANLRVPRSHAIDIFLSIRSMSDEPSLGLSFASFVKSETFDFIEYAARASATVGDAIRVTNRYARWVDDSFAFSLEPHGPLALWRFFSDWPEPACGIITEYILGVVARASRLLFGSAMPSNEVWVRGPAPRDLGPYERTFSGPVRFSAPDYGILLSPSMLELCPRGADPALARLLERQAESMLAEVPGERLCDEVRRALLDELRQGAHSMGRVARRLSTTPSTLRRRLSEEGVRYKDLLEAARRECACKYLSDQRLTTAEIAFRLGYRDATTFFKVFKRWTGQTPAEYRRQCLALERHRPKAPALRRRRHARASPKRAAAAPPPGAAPPVEQPDLVVAEGAPLTGAPAGAPCIGAAARAQVVASSLVTVIVCSSTERGSLDEVSNMGVGPPEHFTDWPTSFSSAGSCIDCAGL